MAKRTPAEEAKKQAVDQPLHVAMSVASVLAVGAAVSALWRRAPSWASAAIAGLVTAAWEFAREWSQWPPRADATWDPYLDGVFEIGGIALGVFVLVRWVAPAITRRLRP